MAEDFFAAFDKRHTAAASTQPFTPVAPGRDVSAYAAKALAEELDRVRTAPQGSRNHELNVAALKLGRLVAAGALEHDHVRAELGAADTRPGDTGVVAWKTIDSGLSAGLNDPRNIPALETPPWITDTPSDDPFASLAGSPNGAATPATSSSADVNSDASSSDSSSTDGPARTAPSGDSPSTATPEKTIGQLVREQLPAVDWHAAWHSKTEVEWISEPLLAARRQVVIYSPAKVGKSLLMLEIAFGICAGRSVLGTKPARPYRVLYVDFENDLEDDIIPRLRNMGAEPGDLQRLDYLSLPTLAALDTEQGALQLVAAIDEYGSEVVVIDTVSRAVSGDENENDTWLRFYRHTGLKLKQRRVAMIRLDHTGKDEAKGQRGGSAKTGDIDAVWRMMRLTDGNDGQPETFRLVCELKRFPISETVLTLVREEGPLRHTVKPVGARDIIVAAIIAHLDDTDTPLKAGRDAVNLADVKSAVPGATQRLLTDAIKQRRTMHGEPDEAAA